MCKKQCRDENAFKQHKLSSFHQQRMFEFHQNPEVFLEKYSEEFDQQFNEVFKIKFGSASAVPATKAYNEYIKDPHHTHLNSTKWANLAEYSNYLGETGRYEVTKERVGDSDQIMIKLIDIDEGKQGQLTD
ncbi:dna rna-binding protein kin17-like [Stylonychia lemnae]|uniref:Dna rna-binding protein kin17-like n=1 Tax=Stylonychia lemnae TaxID=5949 RepID=A0A078B080_STYLE|nr:dna rna-binding protein kin17-like [Stylonychia lemnae]|eukprot:CDW86817.1 dna rna-binding protein kin17-like [Stylonychia lemnae]